VPGSRDLADEVDEVREPPLLRGDLGFLQLQRVGSPQLRGGPASFYRPGQTEQPPTGSRIPSGQTDTGHTRSLIHINTNLT